MTAKRFSLIGLCLAVASTGASALDTGVTGGGQAFNNYQPSLVVSTAIPMSGIFPSRDSGSGFAAGGTLGFVYEFAGNFAPGGKPAQGQVLPIVQNTAVFSLMGTTYGGNGTSNFALPNLAGQSIIGASGNTPLGSQIGSGSVTLTTAQLPAHSQTLPGGGVTGVTGGGLPFDNQQPSLALTRVIATQGIFPSSGGGGGSSAFLGQVATFAGNFAPSGWAAADGSVLSISGNEALFAIIGTTYGGNGTTTFALPDLRDRVSVGASNSLLLGTVFGQSQTTLTSAQLAAHSHTIPGGNTGIAGQSAPVTNDQQSLALNYLIALNGIFPSRDGGSPFDMTTPVLGQITEFAGNYAPSGWAFANGQLLSIAQNQALFALLGTQYGGDGIRTFALPDFRGRTLVGAGTFDGQDFYVGETFGSDTNVLLAANLPAHVHSLPDVVDNGNVPEPASLALLGLGLAGIAALRRCRQV